MTKRSPDLVLDGIPFWADPRISYPHDYVRIFSEVSVGKLPKLDVLRTLICEDPFFVAYFVCGWREYPGVTKGANHPFIVKLCKELMVAPEDYRLLLAARGHGKTTIDTIGGTIRDICRDPERTNAIFSFTRAAAQSILRSIKQIIENSNLLKMTFPEIFYENPEREAKVWSEDKGLLLKRKSTRQELTVEAWGLEKLPTGKHFNNLRYDDIVTLELVNTPALMAKTVNLFDMSLNLVSDPWKHTVTGTFYHHQDILNKLLERKQYYVIFEPATHNGQENGIPVFLSKKELEKKKVNMRTFRTQQLLDPTPSGTKILKKENLREIKASMIPDNLYRATVIDPASSEGMEVNKGDAWAIITLGFDRTLNEDGFWDCYLLDCEAKQLTHTQAMHEIKRQVLKHNSRVVAVEKVGMSSVEIHVANMLKAAGKNFSVQNKRLQTVSPKGRNKNQRIEDNLSFPLDNGRLFLSSKIKDEAKDVLFTEMDEFPYGHANILDAWAYGVELVSQINMHNLPPPIEDDRWSVTRWMRENPIPGKENADKDAWRYV